MLRPRIIPCLLLGHRGLVKTVRFRDGTYLGDPVNTARIFNDKHVDELVLLDITATRVGRGPHFDLIERIASECFVPLTYGGGIRSVEEARRVLALGAEKIAINTAAVEDPKLISTCATRFGTQSVVVSLDAMRDDDGLLKVYARGGRQATGLGTVECAQRAQELGAGEVLLTSIDRDGTRMGYDLDMVREVTSALHIPVIACGGAGSLRDFREAVVEAGASAVAAGSMFVFYGRLSAVLISYPQRTEVENLFT